VLAGLARLASLQLSAGSAFLDTRVCLSGNSAIPPFAHELNSNKTRPVPTARSVPRASEVSAEVQWSARVDPMAPQPGQFPPETACLRVKAELVLNTENLHSGYASLGSFRPDPFTCNGIRRRNLAKG
jgi:hypothetical protein